MSLKTSQRGFPFIQPWPQFPVLYATHPSSLTDVIVPFTTGHSQLAILASRSDIRTRKSPNAFVCGTVWGCTCSA